MRILTEPASFQAAGRIAAMLMLTGVFTVPEAAGDDANTHRENVLFAQQDHVTAFNLATGAGQQVGTVTGKVSGTSIVNFQFVPTGPLTFNFDNKVVITDLDGDQLRIRNQGTGKFIVSIDATVFGLGGPMVGTYEVLAGTGKYVSWVGKKFPYRAVAGNPSGGLGTVYAEVLSGPASSTGGGRHE
jgi:outer membrane protein assembly factor BamB